MKHGVQQIKNLQPDASTRIPEGASSLEKCIGREIRNIRKRRGLTATELTAMAGLSSGFLSKIEKGLISPSLNTLKRLADTLDIVRDGSIL
jgi:predicted transcriptional regulator